MEIATFIKSSAEGFNPEWLSGIGELLTGIAVFLFGFFGLRQYKEGHQLDAGKVLLNMEEEFRRICHTCSEIEVGSAYQKNLQPLLQKLNAKDCASLDLTADEFNRVKELDRALRFFYVCTILHDELRVEEGVLGRAYYYWLDVFVHREELHNYIKKDYKRLAQWLQDNAARLEVYRQTGQVLKK